MTLVKKLVAAVTSLHVLAHSVFGCCGHDMHASAAAEHRCDRPARSVSEAGTCHHSLAATAAVSCEAEHAESIPSADDSSAPRHRHQCRHADCHWKAGEAHPDIKLLAAIADAAIVAAVPDRYAHDRSIGPLDENDVGRQCALRLRLQLMCDVLQI